MILFINAIALPAFAGRACWKGDVVAIYDTTGNKVVEYSYDAWGNCTIESATTNYDLAHANPIRYKGYYYDEATKLYYLNARYYSPEFRRFISLDDTNYLVPKNVNGCNLYSYCGNDPVNFVDPSGHLIELGVIVFLVMAVAFVATTTATAVVVVGVTTDGLGEKTDGLGEKTIKGLENVVEKVFGNDNVGDIGGGLIKGASTPYYDPEPNLFQDDFSVTWE